MASEAKAAFDNHVGRGEGSLDVTGRDFAPIKQIIAELGMEYRRSGRQRVLEFVHHRELVPVYTYQLGSILGDGADLGCDRPMMPSGRSVAKSFTDPSTVVTWESTELKSSNPISTFGGGEVTCSNF